MIDFIKSLPEKTIGTAFKRISKLNLYFEVGWKKSSSLKPTEVLGAIRGLPKHGFYEYYHPRQEVEKIKNKIELGKNVLVIGHPLSGKTRAVYQALTTLKDPPDVIIPRPENINREDFKIPKRFRYWRKKLVFIDDLNEFVDKQNFSFLIEKFSEQNAVIIGTCQLGPEYDKVCKLLEKEIAIFGEPIMIPKVSLSEDEAEEIEKHSEIKVPRGFYGNLGELFLPLDKMRTRFTEADKVEKTILRSLKRLYFGGIYKGRAVFPLDWVKKVVKKVEGEEKSQSEWTELLHGLRNKGFIEINKDEIISEERYLKDIIEIELELLTNFNELLDVFSKDAEPLFLLGNRAYEIGLIDMDKSHYMRLAIQVYKEALKVYTLERFPMQYAMTQNNLGNAYQTLAEVEDKKDNCEKAIQVYKEALKVYTLERFPMDYATTQNNLGAAYRTLAEVEDKKDNCEKAIQVYKEALKVYTEKDFPEVYPRVYQNLMTLYKFCK